MNRTYKVFISSTFRHLQEARKAAVAGVSAAGHIPVSLENFAPENSADVDVIKRELEESHIYVLILGPTYGQRPKNKGKKKPSFVEIEYEKALRAGKEMLIFTLAWDAVKDWRNQCLDQIEDEEEVNNLRDLRRFYTKVCNRGYFRREWDWDKTHEIRDKVFEALVKVSNRSDPPPPRGLVQEINIEQSEFLAASENQFVTDIIASISGYEKLYKRTTANAELKEKAAEYFASRIKRHLDSDKFNGIFFESGSSIAFVAKQMAQDLQMYVRIGSNGQPTKRILTNNVLVYLTLWLNRNVPCYHFPWGGPEGSYGATFGPISSLGDSPPTYDGRPIDVDAEKAIKRLDQSPLSFIEEPISLIITAASGLQLSNRFTFASDEKFTPDPKTKELVQKYCSGPHVGSFKNKIFKRYLYQAEIPLVLFVDSGKIDREIDTRKCHFIFDTKDDWQSMLATQAFAICVACQTDELESMRETVRRMMDCYLIEDSGGGDKYACLIAWNKKFDSAFSSQATRLV